MNIWDLANWFAWIASFMLFTIMAIDFLKIERGRRQSRLGGKIPAKEPKGGGQ